MLIRWVRWLFVLTLTAFICLAYFLEWGELGLSMQISTNGYRLAGGTELWALAVAAVFLCLYVVLMFSSIHGNDQPMLSLRRRYCAFWLDFLVAIFMIGPILGVIAVVYEWKRTGTFAWSFVRTDTAPGDQLLSIETLFLCFIALLLYFALPLKLHKPSPGSCILGYRVFSEYERKMTWGMAIQRTLFGFVAVARGPFSDWRRQQKSFWLDEKFATVAVKLE